MKQAFACTLVALVGCTSGGGSKGTLTATWSLKNIDGSAAACMSGYGTMKVTAFYHDAAFGAADPGQVPITALFDCAAGTGTMELQTTGTIDTSTLDGKYDIEWDETDSTGNTAVVTDLQSQLDSPITVDLSSGKASADVTMLMDGGYAWFDWTLFGNTAQDYLDSCAGAGVDKIDIALTDETSMAVTHIPFPCGTSDNSTTGVTGVLIDGIDVVGAGIAPALAGEYTYVATAYSGTTVVGMSDDAEDTTISPANKINILAAGVSIDLTTR